MRKLSRLSTPAKRSRKFTETCVLPISLRCFPAISPGFIEPVFTFSKCSIQLIGHACVLNFSFLKNLGHEHHIKASLDFVTRILGEHHHLLHKDKVIHLHLFKLLIPKATAYLNSVLPAVSRLLADRNAWVDYYLQETRSFSSNQHDFLPADPACPIFSFRKNV